MPFRLVAAITLVASVLTLSGDLAASQVHAAAPLVSDLSPVVMRGSQTPVGFAANSYKLFPTFSTSMTVAGQTCAAGTIKPSEWKQGLHEVLVQPVPPTIKVDLLEVCGYLFTTNTPATGYYQATLARARTTEAKHTTRPLKVPKIGDGAFADYSPLHNGRGIYISIFHYRNALVGITYVFFSTPLMTTTAFVRMVDAMGKRLARGH
jgi:hypothetical protein